MKEKEKEYIKLKLASCFRIILKSKKEIDLQNKANDVEDLRLVSSLRQLESESGLSYTIIQTLSVGKRDIQFTSLISLIENLGLTFSEFANLYDSITEKQISDEKIGIEKNKKKIAKKKILPKK